MRAIESYKDHFLALDYAGNPVAILRRVDGATDDDLEKFIRAHVPNAVSLQNMAEHLGAELDSSESKRRLADMTRKRKVVNEATDAVRFEVETFENDARLKILNDVIQRFVGVDRYSVKPRTPRPEPAPGETGRERAQAAQTALQAAQKVDSRLQKLLDKRQALNEQIDALQQELAQEQSKREAVAIQQAEERARGVEAADKPKSLAQRYREFMRRQEATQKAAEQA